MANEPTTSSGQNQNSTPVSAVSSSAPMPVTGHTSKEAELMPASENHGFSEIKTDMEVEPGMEKFMQPTQERIDLPIDLKQMGMSATGPAQPVATTVAVAPPIKLPLSDEAIEKGLHQNITSSIRWLAEFCVRQLKKAHYHLKRLAGGQVVREQDI